MLVVKMEQVGQDALKLHFCKSGIELRLSMLTGSGHSNATLVDAAYR
jgi:hypothetical protein